MARFGMMPDFFDTHTSLRALRPVPLFRMIKANTFATELPGGVQSDNNALEATNGVLKKFVVGVRLPASAYVPALGEWVEHKSVLDTSFVSGLHSEVHSRVFYKEVSAMDDAVISPVTVSFPATGTVGARWFTSEATLAILRDTGLDTVAQYKKAASKSADPHESRGWLKQHQALRTHPEVECADKDFDAIVEWCSAFYYLRPFPPGTRLLELHFRIKNSGVSIIAYEDLLARGHAGIMLCGCPRFLQRAWCIHSCVDARKKKNHHRVPSRNEPNAPPAPRGVVIINNCGVGDGC